VHYDDVLATAIRDSVKSSYKAILSGFGLAMVSQSSQLMQNIVGYPCRSVPGAC
jgi:hypothetical protein